MQLKTVLGKPKINISKKIPMLHTLSENLQL